MHRGRPAGHPLCYMQSGFVTLNANRHSAQEQIMLVIASLAITILVFLLPCFLVLSLYRKRKLSLLSTTFLLGTLLCSLTLPCLRFCIVSPALLFSGVNVPTASLMSSVMTTIWFDLQIWSMSWGPVGTILVISACFMMKKMRSLSTVPRIEFATIATLSLVGWILIFAGRSQLVEQFGEWCF